MSTELRVTRDRDVWTLALDRPEKRNALSPDLVEALIAAVEDAPRAGARLLVLRGEGRNFSAGFDFGDMASVSEGELLRRFVRIEMLLQTIARSPCLTLALTHGRNFGAGVDLAAVCRWRVGAPEASYHMPGLGFGLVLGTRRFAALVGADAARAILEVSRTFDAAEARALGFLTEVAPAEAWDEIVAEARHAACFLPDGSRAALYEATGHGDGDLDRDLALLVRSASAPGLRERIIAYLDARR